MYGLKYDCRMSGVCVMSKREFRTFHWDRVWWNADLSFTTASGFNLIRADFHLLHKVVSRFREVREILWMLPRPLHWVKSTVRISHNSFVCTHNRQNLPFKKREKGTPCGTGESNHVAGSDNPRWSWLQHDYKAACGTIYLQIVPLCLSYVTHLPFIIEKNGFISSGLHCAIELAAPQASFCCIWAQQEGNHFSFWGGFLSLSLLLSISLFLSSQRNWLCGRIGWHVRRLRNMGLSLCSLKGCSAWSLAASVSKRKYYFFFFSSQLLWCCN